MFKVKEIVFTWATVLCVMVVALWAVESCVGCGPINPSPGPEPNPEAGTLEDCDDACNNLMALGCPGWEGSPGTDEEFGNEDDIPCTQVCEDLMSSDPTLTLYPKCVSNAKTCDEAEDCFEENY